MPCEFRCVLKVSRKLNITFGRKVCAVASSRRQRGLVVARQHKTTKLQKMMADSQDDLFLLPCSNCSRTFRPEALERHERVCEKSLTKKRKVFNSFKARVQGTDLAEFLGPEPLPGQPKKPPPRQTKSPPKKDETKPPKWKQTHEALIATVRGSRRPEDSVGVTPITLAHASDQCPHCGRHFGHRAFDRHVEFCKEVASRKFGAPPKSCEAQERLEARTKYRAPVFRVKSKESNTSVASLPQRKASATYSPQPVSSSPGMLTHRTETRILHSAPAKTTARKTSDPTGSSYERTPTNTAARKSSEPTGSFYERGSANTSGRKSLEPETMSLYERASQDSLPTTPLIRQGTFRSSSRSRGVSPAKSSVTSTPRRNPSPMKAEVQAVTLPQPKIKQPLKAVNDLKQRAVLNKLSMSPDADADYSKLVEAANEQMHALLSWNSSSDIALQAKPFLSRATHLPSNLPSIPASPAPLQTSPTSAFTPVISSKDNDNNFDVNRNETFDTTVDSSTFGLCDSSADAPIPRRLTTSTPISRPSSRGSVQGVTHSSNEAEAVSNRNSLHEEECNRRNSTYSISSHPSDCTLADEGVLWANLEEFTMQQAPLKKSKKKTFARSQSVFEDRNRMLFAQVGLKDGSSPEDEQEGMEVRGRSESIHSRTNPIHSFRPRSPFYRDESPPEIVPEQMIVGGGGGGDSAYSSLNRRSPKPPAIVAQKMSKFCHECGAKFPMTAAKFCCECGIRRLVF